MGAPSSRRRTAASPSACLRPGRIGHRQVQQHSDADCHARVAPHGRPPGRAVVNMAELELNARLANRLKSETIRAACITSRVVKELASVPPARAPALMSSVKAVLKLHAPAVADWPFVSIAETSVLGGGRFGRKLGRVFGPHTVSLSRLGWVLEMLRLGRRGLSSTRPLVFFHLGHQSPQKLVPLAHPRNKRMRSADATRLTRIDPRHPSRFENRKNTSGRPYRPARS